MDLFGVIILAMLGFFIVFLSVCFVILIQRTLPKDYAKTVERLTETSLEPSQEMYKDATVMSVIENRKKQEALAAQWLALMSYDGTEQVETEKDDEDNV